MSTRAERAEEAREEARQHPHCIGCRLGIWHDHDDEENGR